MHDGDQGCNLIRVTALPTRFRTINSFHAECFDVLDFTLLNSITKFRRKLNPLTGGQLSGNTAVLIRYLARLPTAEYVAPPVEWLHGRNFSAALRAMSRDDHC